jgi:hypothetical protein
MPDYSRKVLQSRRTNPRQQHDTPQRRDMIMTSWPAAWPTGVREFYESLANQFDWSDHVVDGVTANVEYLRCLEASGRKRSYFCGGWEGERWLFETVEDGAELVAIRQIVIDQDGAVHRYSWRRREDDDGALTDQAVEPTAALDRCESAEFADAWGTGDPET